MSSVRSWARISAARSSGVFVLYSDSPKPRIRMSAGSMLRFGRISGALYERIVDPVRAMLTPLPPGTTNGAIRRPPFLNSMSTTSVEKVCMLGKKTSTKVVVGVNERSTAPRSVRVSSKLMVVPPLAFQAGKINTGAAQFGFMRADGVAVSDYDFFAVKFAFDIYRRYCVRSVYRRR